MSEEAEEWVKRYISDQTGVSIPSISNSANLTDLGVDSMEKLMIAGELEDHFNINFPDDSLATMKTVQDAINYIEKKCGN